MAGTRPVCQPTVCSKAFGRNCASASCSRPNASNFFAVPGKSKSGRLRRFELAAAQTTRNLARAGHVGYSAGGKQRRPLVIRESFFPCRREKQHVEPCGPPARYRANIEIAAWARRMSFCCQPRLNARPVTRFVSVPVFVGRFKEPGFFFSFLPCLSVAPRRKPDRFRLLGVLFRSTLLGSQTSNEKPINTNFSLNRISAD